MTWYLDASVLVPTMIEEPSSSAIDNFLLTNRQGLFVSDFAAAEVASAMSRVVRVGTILAETARAALSDFDAWVSAATEQLELTAADLRLATVYVRRFDLMLRTPDALHLAMCRRLQFTLVTLDARLHAAARTVGVSAVSP